MPTGSLWPTLIDRWHRALATGALQPIETDQQVVEDAGVQFVVRRVASLQRKPQERSDSARNKAPSNPFLPHDPQLFVADVSPTHVALLNKYPVIRQHLLIVTRQFENQEALLAPRDFAALAACLAEIDGLGFYNAGGVAGASQPHKHLQIVPLPLGGDRSRVPIEPLLALAAADARPDCSPHLPFAHRRLRLEPALFGEPECAGEVLSHRYRSLCLASGIEGQRVGASMQHSAPYNLLLTREWMLLVPRACESACGISINALGFAGSLFVRDAEQLRQAVERGPMSLLRAVAQPPR